MLPNMPVASIVTIEPGNINHSIVATPDSSQSGHLHTTYSWPWQPWEQLVQVKPHASIVQYCTSEIVLLAAYDVPITSKGFIFITKVSVLKAFA